MNLKIGEWVRYSPAFIKSIAAPELARVYGVIRADNGPVRPGGPHYLRVKWIDQPDDSGVLSCNITKYKK
jgi:hypothetical protein